MSLSSSPPPGSETGTPRPYTVVPLTLSSSPDSSPEPTIFLRLSSSPPPGSETGTPRPYTVVSLPRSSSPESSPNSSHGRKRKHENADENADEDEEQSPDGSCNQGPLSPGTPFWVGRKESRRKVRYVSPNETSTSPYYRPTSPEYGPASPSYSAISLSTIEENKLEVILFLGARSRNFFPDISDAPLGWLSNPFLKISKEKKMDPCDVVEEIIICVAKHATWQFVVGFYVEIKHFEYGDFSDMLLDERSKHVNYDKEKKYFAALDWWS